VILGALVAQSLGEQRIRFDQQAAPAKVTECRGDGHVSRLVRTHIDEHEVRR
jgi:hypothetical protein